MKTIADIKRKMIVGTTWETTWKCRDNFKYMGIRKVAKVQSNSYGFRTVKENGEIIVSWCDCPKKDEVIFIDENTFKIKHGDIELTYTFLSD